MDHLLDGGSFIEYGPLAVAGQRSRRPIEELRRISPADGLVAGTGSINADEFGPEAARCLVMAYDYTVFAGTQGFMSHRKSDRVLELAERLRCPVVLFAEGGGGSFQRAAVCAVSWPTGEFGAMGLEGAVQLAYRSELAAITDELARKTRYDELVGKLYEHGKAVNIAPFLAFDDVIDPADTRHWLARSLQALPPEPVRTGKKRPNIDPW